MQRMDRCGTIAAAVVVAVLAGAGYADLMPIAVAESGVEGRACVSAPSEVGGSPVPEPYLAQPSAFALASDCLGETLGAASVEGAEPPSVHVLADRSDSFDLCLYTLLGLGVFRSGQWIRKPSLGFIPAWYHDGAPFRIGHSLAVSPDCVCSLTVCCIAQPPYAAEDRIPKYRSRTVLSLWRRSQFTPDVLAARGPPVTC